MTITYSNPRTHAVVANYPIGGSKRGDAVFSIEVTTRGERGVRVTTGKPKTLTYARKARIVDGDNGRTYIIELTSFGFISVMRGDFKYQEETIHRESQPERHAEVLKLFANQDEADRFDRTFRPKE